MDKWGRDNFYSKKLYKIFEYKFLRTFNNLLRFGIIAEIKIFEYKLIKLFKTLLE